MRMAPTHVRTYVHGAPTIADKEESLPLLFLFRSSLSGLTADQPTYGHFTAKVVDRQLSETAPLNLIQNKFSGKLIQFLEDTLSLARLQIDLLIFCLLMMNL